MKAFDSRIKMQAKALYVDERMTLEDIAAQFNGKPSRSTIANWTSEKDKNGKTWDDYRNENDEYYYMQLTPGGMARVFHERLSQLLQDKSMDGGQFGDAVRKLTASMKDIIDPAKQIGVIFGTLRDLIDHAENTYRADKDHLLWLSKVLSTFRDQVKERLAE
jgi:hypothetical protein